MFRKVVLLLVLPLVLFGANLSFESGVIQAHTKVFGDSSIDPSVKNIKADLSMQDDSIDSLKGKLSFNIIDFKSSNDGRDEHMQEMFDMKKHSDISLSINKVTPQNKQYLISATLNMHGVQKPIDINSTITKNDGSVSINANFSVKVSDYGMEPPSLLFFTVRDRVDINASIMLKQVQ